MIGKRKSETPTKDAGNIVITSTERIPGKTFEILDVVLSDKHKYNLDKEFESAKKELRSKAMALGADAVVSMRLALPGNAPYADIYAYGTAVRFINEEGDSK